MQEEEKEKSEDAKAQFQSLMFAHAYMGDNAELYEKLYPQAGLSEEEEAELDWEVPQTEADVRRMMNELAEVMG